MSMSGAGGGSCWRAARSPEDSVNGLLTGLRGLPRHLPGALADAAHHDEDRGRILRRALHEVLDRAADDLLAVGVLAELVGQDLLAALALHREGKAVLDCFGLGEIAADLDIVG